MVLVAGLVHDRLRVVAAHSILAGGSPHEHFPMQLGGNAINLEAGCLYSAHMSLDVPIQGIQAALAAGTPEEGVVGESGRRRYAVGRTGGACRKIAKQIYVGIQYPGEFVILPERIEFGEIGNIETLVFQAGVVENGL